MQTFTYSAATPISCIKRDGISQHYRVQMPGESLWEGLSNTAEFPGFLSPKSLLSLFLPGHSGITGQLHLLLACLHTDNLPSSRVVNWGGPSSPRKTTSHSILASRCNDQSLAHWPKSNAWPQSSLLKKVTIPNLSHKLILQHLLHKMLCISEPEPSPNQFLFPGMTISVLSPHLGSIQMPGFFLKTHLL